MQVVDHITANLDESHSVESLAGFAAISKFHFQRLFSATFGIAIAAFIGEQRLKRAAYQLAFRPRLRVVDIALAAGFSCQEAFTRAFKKRTGWTPAAFRRDKPWQSWSTLGKPGAIGVQIMPQLIPFTAEIVHFNQTMVALLEHQGPPELVMQTVQRFIQWRKAHGPSPKISATWNIFYSDPEETPPTEYRFGVAASVAQAVAANDQGVQTSSIPAGRCARVRIVGSDAQLKPAFQWLYGTWLPQSEESVRDFPCFLQRVTMYPDVSESAAQSDLYLPLISPRL